MFSSSKDPQKHCRDLKIKTSTSSKRTTLSFASAIRVPAGIECNLQYKEKCYKTLHEKNTEAAYLQFTNHLAMVQFALVFGSK